VSSLPDLPTETGWLRPVLYVWTHSPWHISLVAHLDVAGQPGAFRRQIYFRKSSIYFSDWIPRRLGQDVPLDARARTVRRFPGCLHNPTKGLPAREKMRRGAIAKFNFCMVGRTTP